MTILRIDPNSDPRWQAFLASHPDARVFHTSGWLEALRRTYGYEPVVYTAAEPGQRLVNGIPFCRIRSRLTGQRLVSVPFSDHCQPLAGNSEELRELLLAAREDALKSNCRYVEIKPLTPCQSGVVKAVGLGNSADAFVHRLDLCRSPEDVFRGFHKDCIQRKIARSGREKLEYEEGRSEVLLQKFYRLLLLTRRRQQLPPQPLLWFRNLIDCLGEQLKIRIASKDGTAIAAIITLSFNKVVTYKYSCSDSRFNPLGGAVFLIWRTVQEAMSEGATELDFGRSDSDNPGLIAFKDHWGAARSTMTYYRYPAARNRVSTNQAVVAAARRLMTAIPDSLFSTLGRVLYRHAG
jgi:hypothetical protein